MDISNCPIDHFGELYPLLRALLRSNVGGSSQKVHIIDWTWDLQALNCVETALEDLAAQREPNEGVAILLERVLCSNGVAHNPPSEVSNVLGFLEGGGLV